MASTTTVDPGALSCKPVALSRFRLVANFIVFQAAWFAAVLGAANDLPLWGTACVFSAIAWHVAVSADPPREFRLVLSVSAIGFVVETLVVWQGHIAYPSGQPDPRLAPYWMVAMWSLLAMTLNVNLRWLKRRWLWAAVLGAVAGPLSFTAGVRLGGARFVDATPALVQMALGWAALMPLLMWLSDRFDGVLPKPVVKEAQHV